MELSTTYLGLELPHPFIPGACPLSRDLDLVRQLEDAGAPLIPLHSLFEEQLLGEGLATLDATEGSEGASPEALSYFPEPDDMVFGPEGYLEHIRKIREAVDIPIVASLNGTTPGGWLKYAKLIEDAGANALELNVYDIATDPLVSGQELEDRTIEMVKAVKEEISIPLAVKLSPFYTSVPNFAKRLDEQQVDGIVLFNRFFQPDVDIEELEVVSSLFLSTSAEVLLRLRWIAILYGNVNAKLAVTGGVHTATDAIKSIMCGASAVQVVSALFQNGPKYLGTLRDNVAAWMEENEYESIAQMRGSMSLKQCPNPKEFERANYVQVLRSWRQL